MSTIEDIISEIKGESWRQYTDNEEYRRGVYLEDVGDIIRKHCEGMVLVPAEPTELMLNHALGVQVSTPVSAGAIAHGEAVAKAQYKAMLSASQGEGK